MHSVAFIQLKIFTIFKKSASLSMFWSRRVIINQCFEELLKVVPFYKIFTNLFIDKSISGIKYD